MIKDVAPISGFLEVGAEPADAARQLCAVLTQLCDLVQKTADGEGWEAWRVFTRRFGPHGAGKRQHHVTNEMRSAMLLPDNNKSSILTVMTKVPLKKHFVLKLWVRERNPVLLR